MKIFISHSANTPVSALLSLLHEEDAIIVGSFELAPAPNPMESIHAGNSFSGRRDCGP